MYKNKLSTSVPIINEALQHDSSVGLKDWNLDTKNTTSPNFSPSSIVDGMVEKKLEEMKMIILGHNLKLRRRNLQIFQELPHFLSLKAFVWWWMNMTWNGVKKYVKYNVQGPTISCWDQQWLVGKQSLQPNLDSFNSQLFWWIVDCWL